MMESDVLDEEMLLTREEKTLLEKSRVQEKRGKLISLDDLRKKLNL